MAITVTLTVPRVERMTRNLGIILGTVAFDSSYPTGGEDCTDITKYFSSMKHLHMESVGYFFNFDYTNSKIKVYVPVNITAGSGSAGANNYIIGISSLLEIDGSGTAFQVAAAEVLNTTDLSGITAARFIAIGQI